MNYLDTKRFRLFFREKGRGLPGDFVSAIRETNSILCDLTCTCTHRAGALFFAAMTGCVLVINLGVFTVFLIFSGGSNMQV